MRKHISYLGFEIENLEMSVEMASSLQDEMDRAVIHYKKALESGEEVNVEEIVRKLAFFNNMLHLQIDNLTGHMKNAKENMDSLRQNTRI